VAKKIKIINPNAFEVGINFMDGVKSTIIPSKGYRLIDEEEVDYINSTSNMFRRKMLIIDDIEKNIEFGYDVRTIANYTDDEIRELIKGNINKMKSVLSNEKEKHVIDRVIAIAKEFDDLNLNKVKFLEEWSGYDFKSLEEGDKK
jgi:hypothetical protein